MLYVIEVLFLVVFAYFWYKRKFGERDAAFVGFPTPNKRFLLHNMLEFFDPSLPEILMKFKKWQDELGDIYLLTLHPLDTGCVIIADHKIGETISFHQPNRFNTQTYKPLSRWVGDNGYLMSGGNRWKTLMKPVLNVYHPKNIERVSAL
jgi:hypothetical protein